MNRRNFLQLAGGLGLVASPWGRQLASAATPRYREAQFSGVWLSPDWYFPGDRKYSEAEVRNKARHILRGLADSGISAVFLETLLRGHSLSPAVEGGRFKVTQIPYQAGVRGLPIYPHLNWGYRTEVDTIYDPLEVFIEEGQRLGIEIHAWVHCFYWMMDNQGAMLPWHSAPSLWSQMLLEYLRDEGQRLNSDLLKQAADLFARTTDAHPMSELLVSHRINPDGRPLGVLLSEAIKRGARRPEFLLMSSDSDPFPAGRGRALRSIYMNPAHPRVQKTLLDAISSIVKGHPNLAGIHLDHIRYPVDGQGLPQELGVRDGTYKFYSQGDPVELERFNAIGQQLQERRETLRKLVNQAREVIGPRKRLSAAVLPSYYRERDNGRFRLCGYDYSSQDWVSWKVDFVVPMLYEMNPYYIRSLLELFALEQEKRLGDQKILVYPGVSQLRLGSSGELSAPGWVYFDLKQARDIKIERREQTEDTNFGPQ